MPLGGAGIGFSAAPFELSLAGAQSYLVPSGQYIANLWLYTLLEWFDNNLGFWRNTGASPGTEFGFSSDGTNFRLINRTGCPQGAIMTNLGSAYTSAPTVVSSAGGSLWRAVLGGAFNTTVTVTTGGAYNYVPTIIFPPAPAGGITATATATISGGTITGVTVINRGAGYATAPTGTIACTAAQLPNNLGVQGNNIIVVADPRETGKGGAVLTVNSTLAGSGVVTAVLCIDPGQVAQTSLPTLTFSGGGGSSAAATVIMNWTVTGMTVGAGGATYGNAQPFEVTGTGLLNASADASGDVNPAHNLGLIQPRNFQLDGTSTAGGAVTATGLVIRDAGFGIQAVPNGIVSTGNASGATIPTVGAQVSFSVGATTDTSFLQLLKL